MAEFEAFTPDYLMEKMGITPAQFIDLKALMGDKSDNIPGVTKIGEKTGLKLLLEHGSLEGIYDHIDEMKKSKMKENLINDKEQAFLSKTLATIDTQSPIEIGLDDTAFTGPDLENWQPFMTRWALFSSKMPLVERLCRRILMWPILSLAK